MEWCYEPDLSRMPGRDFDAAILDREVTETEFDFLIRFLRAYTLFVTEAVPLEEGGPTRRLMERKRGERISAEALPVLLREDLPDYFPEPYGEKFTLDNLSVARGFRGEVFWMGFEGVELRGAFGDVMAQAVFWRHNIPIMAYQTIEFWLEYGKDGPVDLLLELTAVRFGYGVLPEKEEVWTFTEKDLEEVVRVENRSGDKIFLFASVRARGSGRLRITALHDRYSRKGKGHFIPGGKRWVTSDREEVFYYFDPGNLKPPLNVYFSGYRRKEGFEGYGMMREMGHPFLLITDARLEGGGAYMGTEEYEDAIETILRRHMRELGFESGQVILSGISMGSFGALYYGCRIRPHTILVGKPLASFGDIAENERINRPGGFPTSLDLLHKHCKSLSRDAAGRLNGRFWDAFDKTRWDGTQFAAAYMIEDDYDKTAYGQLLAHLRGTGVKIYGKGLHGRHNDDTDGIVSWFLGQYYRILRDDFGDAETGTGGQG